MRDAWLDLLLGSRCEVCGAAGRLLCRDCAAALPRTARVCWPTPCPPGLALPVAVGEYDGALKVLVNAHKERRAFALAEPLGALLAAAALGVVERTAQNGSETWVLVPVRSRGPVVRTRGHDPVLRMARQAAGLLRRRGVPTAVASLLRSTAVPRDQAGLSAAERAANLAGTMAARRGTARLQDRRPRARLVVVDDVLTTGSTAREAQRALEATGSRVSGIATVAATRRRAGVPEVTRESGAWLPFSHRDD